MKLLFHCCCAPCSINCVSALRSEGIEPDLFWYNPNIHPFTEYKSRKDSVSLFADTNNLKLNMLDEYGLRLFIDSVYPKKNRCDECYYLRLEKAASFAAQNNYSAFSTSLLISPYQDHAAVKRIAEEMAAKYNVNFLYRDFRPLFRESRSAALSQGFYIQKYCGCIFSEEERYRKHQKTDSPEPQVRMPPDTNEKFDRLSLLIGKKGLEKLANTNVLVFGLGGVGSWAAEALVRCGIGKIGIFDFDKICESNINRQIEATSLTIGEPKADALKKRLLEINPECKITAWNERFNRENAHLFNIEKADYVIDAIDILNNKLDLIETVCKLNVTLFSSMGMAFRMDPSKIKASSIWETQGCPLARLVRQGLRKRGFSLDFTAVYSSEQILRNDSKSGEELIFDMQNIESKAKGSAVNVTAGAGFNLASLVIRDVTGL